MLLFISSSHLCAESLQSVVSVLSQVESESEVGAIPTASAASVAPGAGINPVSRDTAFAASYFDGKGCLQVLKSVGKNVPHCFFCSLLYTLLSSSGLWENISFSFSCYPRG